MAFVSDVAHVTVLELSQNYLLSDEMNTAQQKPENLSQQPYLFPLLKFQK